MGTVHENQTAEEFIKDHQIAAQKALETGAQLLEVNLSCPNIGNEGLICYNVETSGKIVKAIREVIGDIPLSVKIGYFQDDVALAHFVENIQNYVQGIASVNTIPAEVVDENGNQALPGPNRLKSGICGAGIKWAGLEMTRRLHALRKSHGYSYIIESMGGVMNPDDYQEYKKAGADVVMSATGAMWDPYLAQEIKKSSR
jgi:dihydroorotate dehydrogenase